MRDHSTSLLQLRALVSIGPSGLPLVGRFDPERVIQYTVDAAAKSDQAVVCADLSGEWENLACRAYMDLPPMKVLLSRQMP